MQSKHVRPDMDNSISPYGPTYARIINFLVQSTLPQSAGGSPAPPNLAENSTHQHQSGAPYSGYVLRPVPPPPRLRIPPPQRVPIGKVLCGLRVAKIAEPTTETFTRAEYVVLAGARTAELHLALFEILQDRGFGDDDEGFSGLGVNDIHRWLAETRRSRTDVPDSEPVGMVGSARNIKANIASTKENESSHKARQVDALGIETKTEKRQELQDPEALPSRDGDMSTVSSEGDSSVRYILEHLHDSGDLNRLLLSPSPQNSQPALSLSRTQSTVDQAHVAKNVNIEVIPSKDNTAIKNIPKPKNQDNIPKKENISTISGPSNPSMRNTLEGYVNITNTHRSHSLEPVLICDYDAPNDPEMRKCKIYIHRVSKRIYVRDGNRKVYRALSKEEVDEQDKADRQDRQEAEDAEWEFLD